MFQKKSFSVWKRNLKTCNERLRYIAKSFRKRSDIFMIIYFSIYARKAEYTQEWYIRQEQFLSDYWNTYFPFYIHFLFIRLLLDNLIKCFLRNFIYWQPFCIEDALMTNVLYQGRSPCNFSNFSEFLVNFGAVS